MNSDVFPNTGYDLFADAEIGYTDATNLTILMVTFYYCNIIISAHVCNLGYDFIGAFNLC